jgi:hypothetical protein
VTLPNERPGLVGQLPLTVMEAMSRFFENNVCLGRGDLRAEITLEALQRSETADHWIINRKKLSRADVMELMLNLVAEGHSVPSILSIPGMPKNRTYITWMNEYKVFSDMMEVAEQMRATILSEQAIEIIDSADPTGKRAFRDKARADLRMKMAEVLHSRKFGKKQTVDVHHSLDDLSSPEVWSRFASVLTVHADMIEAKTGIKILLPADVREAEVLHFDEGDQPEPDIATLGMEGALPDDEGDWNSGLDI